MPQAVVIFLMVTAFWKRKRFLVAPGFGSVIDKLRAVIAMELHYRQHDDRLDVSQRLKSPLVGVIEKGAQFNPAGNDVSGRFVLYQKVWILMQAG